MPNQAMVPYIQTLDTIRPHIKALIPPHVRRTLSEARFSSMLLASIGASKNLQKCSPKSIMTFALEAAGLGLTPGGPLAQIHPVPYKGTCKAIIDFKGLIALARRSGIITRVHADVVKENDTFSYAMTPWPTLRHEIDLKSDRGATIAAYCISQMPSGEDMITVIDMDTIQKAKASSPSARSGYGPWVEHFDPMAMKTAIKRQSKLWQSCDLIEGAWALEDDGQASGLIPPETLLAAQEDTAAITGEVVDAADSALALIEAQK